MGPDLWLCWESALKLYFFLEIQPAFLQEDEGIIFSMLPFAACVCVYVDIVRTENCVVSLSDH